MAEYIERDALRAKAVYMHGFGENKYVPLKAIENAPAADVEPVKHGRWVYKPYENDEAVWLYHCSECNALSATVKNYCYNCGAKMDLEDRQCN